MRIAPLSAELDSRWDAFVRSSRNATFLFERAFMSYHADRFVDASVVVLDEEKIVGLFPATRHGEQIRSHGGLTYGGLLVNLDATCASALAQLEMVVQWYREAGARSLLYKAIPHIYHRVPAEDDSYALFRLGFSLVRRDASSSIQLRSPWPHRLTKGRKWNINRARKQGVEVLETRAFARFMAIEEATLLERHNVKPVHSAAEMTLLGERFPQGIRLFEAFREGVTLGGVLVFDCGPTVHAQYIAATPEGRELGATDAIVSHLVNEVFKDRVFFDFGISTESDGRVLNAGLAAFKESFGARTVVYDHYLLDLTADRKSS